ncbi:twin-arginine translocation signal domain-containing protein, partial [Burkholderia vietnamiensis]
MNPNRRHFLAQASALAATFGTAPAILHAQSGTRPLLRAGDQKGGLRALLEAAGELNGVAYDIA